MKKLLSLLTLLALFMPMTIRADEVTIGNGSRTGSIVPFNNGVRYSWNEMIYPSTSFTSSCIINKISFWNSTEEDPFAGFFGGDPFASVTCNILKIYMGVKDANTFANKTDWTPESELTLVYSHNNIVIGGENQGWQDFVLDTPYEYTAEGNLVIVVAKKAQMADGMVTYQYDQVNNTCLYRSHSSNQSYMNHPGTSNGTISNNRARLKLNVTPYELTCHKPTAAEVTGVTPTTASFSWTPYEGSDNFDVYIGEQQPNASTTPTVSNVSGTSYTFTGLTPATQYVMAVRSNCGVGEYTRWRSVMTLTPPDFIGEGTESAPYLLYSMADFDVLSYLMNKGWSTNGKYFRLMNDIEDFNHVTTGTFHGKFDCNNHTVTLNQTGTPTSKNISVFEFLGAGAYIHDLNVEGTLVNNGGDMAVSAGVACKVYIYNTDTEGILVENCVSKVNISAIQGYSTVAAAGIVGNMTGSINSNHHLTIKDCVFDGEINTAHNYSAGIIGQTMYGTVIENCVNKGNITGAQYVGGITGMLQTSTINNCVNKGDVMGTNIQVGGLVGLSYNNATITNSYNLGNVEGLYSVGGIVGESTQSGNIRSYINNVYTTGSVTYTSETYGPDKTGAIIGMNSVKGGSFVDGAYYLEGTGTPFGPASDLSYATNYSGFTRGSGTNCTLTTATFETNDLRTALNNKRDGNTAWNEWFDDVHGNNRYYPTFVVGNAPGLEITPSVLAMGPRPIGAWMHPEVISFTNTSETPLQINSIEFPENTFFTLDGDIEFPIVVGPLATVEVNITTDKNAAIGAGEVSAILVAVWGAERTASIATVTATAYNPAIPDVYEKPQVVTTLPYVNTIQSTTLTNNYYLPGDNPDGPDAVYKLSFENDVNFNAEMTYGSNAKMALYTEDFGGELGPDTENNWRGPVVHHGQPITPKEGWLYYDDGNFVTAIGGTDIYFGIMIPAADLAQYDGCSMSKIQLFDYASMICTYNIRIYQGGDDAPETLVYTQNYVQQGGGIWSVIPLDTPVDIDVNKNLWVTFYVHAISYDCFPAPACANTGDPNGNWISTDGVTWGHATDHGLDYTWMVRAFLTNQEETREESYPISWGGDQAITNLTVPAGTYYLVTSSTSVESTVNINPTTIPTPAMTTYTSPLDGTANLASPVSLEWQLDQFTTEYQLIAGTSYPPTEIVQNWTNVLSDKFVLRNLLSHTNYFWQVNVRNSSGVTEGPIWQFTTTLNKPENFVADTKKSYEGETVTFTWDELGERMFRGYNIYMDSVKLNTQVITDNEYTVEGLEYNMEEGYTFNVTAVYDAGESSYSRDVVVKVSGEGVLSGNIFDQDGVTAIAGAEVTIKGYDEHNIHQVYTTTANANGSYSMTIKAGTYYIGATSEGYDLCYYYNGDDPYVVVNFENETSGININLRETYNPVSQVTAEEISSDMLKVEWNMDKIFKAINETETNNETRALQSYNVYRSNCYNEDDKELIATGITETELMDGGWANLEAGSYKMGVSCIYEGNRGIDLRGTMAYGCCLAGLGLPQGFIKFDIEDAGSARVLSDLKLKGGDYFNGLIYAYDENLNFVKIVPETGEVTYQVYKDFYINELEFDYTTKTMYGISHNDLFTINLENGDTTFVATLSQELVVLGIDVNGNMYGITAYNGDLYSIDRETWECNFIGATGLQNAYIQSGTIDKNTGIFYWAWLDGPAYMSIYDINLETAEATLVSDNMGEITALSIPYDDMPKPLEPGNESAIVWSSCIDKDMIVNVSVSVATNDATSPAGTIVTFENISEPQLSLTYSVSLDETGYYEWDNFRKGTYEYSITKAGFASCANSDIIEINENQDIECLLEETFMPVENLYVSHTGWAMWSQASKGTDYVVSYKVFVNDVFNGESEHPYYQLNVTDFVEEQTYTTSVVALYSTGISEAVDYEWVYIPCEKYETASSYNAEVVDDNVVLTWTTPNKGDEDADRYGDWYYYDNGVVTNSIGTGGGQFYWGVMFPTGSYNGENVTKVLVYDYMAMTGDIMIYEGGTNAPESLIATTPITLTGADAFVEYDVNATIDPSKNLWIVVYNASGATYPAAVCDNTGDANGRWVSTDGVEWIDLASAGLDYTFVLRAYVEGGGTIHADVLGTIIYRDGELIQAQPIAQSTYTDVNPGVGTHEYAIRMVYTNNPTYTGHYYAMGCEQTEEVTILPANVNENEELAIEVYPNPTNGKVFVETNGIKHISIINALGQIVYEQDIDTDNVTIDMSQFQNGMYVMNIITENNLIVRNISLVK